MRSVPSVIYLLHFLVPYKHACHYIGWCAGDLDRRLAAHRAGRGARLLAVCKANDVDWVLARTWRGDRNYERRLKNQGGAADLCPLCGVTPRNGVLFEHELVTLGGAPN